jgi:hypothetical protein
MPKITIEGLIKEQKIDISHYNQYVNQTPGVSEILDGQLRILKAMELLGRDLSRVKARTI